MVLRGSAWQSSLLTEAITRRHSVALRSGVGGGGGRGGRGGGDGDGGGGGGGRGGGGGGVEAIEEALRGSSQQ